MQIQNVPYLSGIVIGLDCANEKEFRQALNFFKQLPQHHRVLWNDGPRLKAIDKELEERGLAPTEMDKGRNVWYCSGYIYASSKGQAIALYDYDILTYDRSLLAKLIYPVANPNFSYQFCKGYYSRIADNKLNGPVVRLLVTPFNQGIKTRYRRPPT